jgi:hypothetical protein
MRSFLFGGLTALLTTVSLAGYAQEDFNFKIAPGAKKGEVIIKGKIGNINYPMQLWYYMGDEPYDTIPIRNGEFELKKNTMLPAYGALILRYTPQTKGTSLFSNANYISLFFEEGMMEISSKVDSLRRHAIVNGAPLYTQYNKYWNDEGEIVREQRALAKIFNEASAAQLQDEKFLAQYEKDNGVILEKLEKRIRLEISNYPFSYATLFAFSNYMEFAKNGNTSNVREIFNLFPETVRKTKHGQFLESVVNQL